MDIAKQSINFQYFNGSVLLVNYKHQLTEVIPQILHEVGTLKSLTSLEISFHLFDNSITK